MRKFGIENFYYEILESKVENYNEKEIYWIEKLNSMHPRGYNCSEGGEEPPSYYGVEHPLASIKDKRILDNIFYLLENTNESYSSIAKKNKTNKKTILQINKGLSYHKENIEYPIRKVPNDAGALSSKDIENIRKLLKENNLNDNEIAKMYNVEYHAIQRINHGETHVDTSIEYPIRKNKIPAKTLDQETVIKIIELILTTKKSLRQISKECEVCVSTVFAINNGSAKLYRKDNLSYPIRKPN